VTRRPRATATDGSTAGAAADLASDIAMERILSPTTRGRIPRSSS